MKAALTCACGQRIFSKDVMQQSWMRRSFGDGYVYLRYRCSRCKRLNECYINDDEWDVRILFEAVPEASDEERRGFDEMGPITPEEIQRVRARLVSLRDLPRPNGPQMPGESRKSSSG